jgi:hypothetical protein
LLDFRWIHHLRLCFGVVCVATGSAGRQKSQVTDAFWRALVCLTIDSSTSPKDTCRSSTLGNSPIHCFWFWFCFRSILFRLAFHHPRICRRKATTEHRRHGRLCSYSLRSFTGIYQLCCLVFLLSCCLLVFSNDVSNHGLLQAFGVHTNHAAFLRGED